MNRVDLKKRLGEYAAAHQAETEQEPEPAQAKTPAKPRRAASKTAGKGAKKPASKAKDTAKDAAESEQQADAEATEQAGTTAEAEQPGRKRSAAITVLGTSTADAQRASLYLPKPYYRAAAEAKLEHGTDLNSLVRAMFALYLGDARIHERIIKLAKQAPRGGQ